MLAEQLTMTSDQRLVNKCLFVNQVSTGCSEINSGMMKSSCITAHVKNVIKINPFTHSIYRTKSWLLNVFSLLGFGLQEQPTPNAPLTSQSGACQNKDKDAPTCKVAINVLCTWINAPVPWHAVGMLLPVPIRRYIRHCQLRTIVPRPREAANFLEWPNRMSAVCMDVGFVAI